MKTVLITGGSSGIGLGISKAFAQAGYAVVMNGLEANGDQIAAEVSQTYGVPTLFSNANMLHVHEIESLIKKTEDFGELQVLVNCAGIQHVAPVEEFPVAKWDAIIGINLTSAFHTSRLVWAGMKERKFGRIINIASAHALTASPFKSAYVAAKHGIAGLTKVLALEGAPFGITCNAICPGYVRTPLVENQIKDQAKAHGISEQEVIQKVMLEKHAIKDFVSVESLGAMALFLASEHASVMTGVCLPMDGGWNAM